MSLPLDSSPNLILFCSTVSSASVPCLKFVKQFNIPVTIVRLDSKEQRERASKGKHIQVNSVPNLVVIHNDNNVQQFIGRDKIIQWFKNSIRQPIQQQNFNKVKKNIKVPKKTKIEKNPIKEIEEESEEEEVEIEYFDSEDDTTNLSKTETKTLKPISGASIMDIAKEMEKQRKESLSEKL